MAPRSTRISVSVTPAARPPRPLLARPQCERLEDRSTPALFNVGTPLFYNGMNNNGCVAVGDLNADGYPDAVFSNYGTWSPTDTSGTPGSSITVLYGKAGGGFNKVGLSTGGTIVSFVEIADLNGDGYPDVVAVNSNANGSNNGTVSVFQNDGAGNLSLVGAPFSTGISNASCVRVADVTGDGVPDVVVGGFGQDTGGGQNVDGNDIIIFQQGADANQKGNFTFNQIGTGLRGPLNLGVQFIPTSFVLADLNGDGIPDLAATVPGVPPDSTSAQPNGSVYLFKGTGNGGFAAPAQLDSGGALPINIQAADLNGDGKLDVVVANAGDPNATNQFSGDSVGVLLNTTGSYGQATSTPSLGVPNSLVSSAFGPFAVADFNVDGKADIAVVNYGSQPARGLSPNSYVTIWQGNGKGSFSLDPTAPNGTYDTKSGIGGGQYLAAGDFDHNGTPDLIVAQASNLVGLMLNTTVPPKVQSVTVNGGQADLTQRSRVTNLQVAFDSTVTISPGAFSVVRTGTINGGAGDNLAVTVGFTTAVVNGKTVATLTFSGANTDSGSLQDGTWTLTVDRTKVSTATGTILLTNVTQGGITRLFGDGNGDGRVNNADLFLFRTSFGLTPADPAYMAWFDFDASGSVNNADLFQFRARFGMSI